MCRSVLCRIGNHGLGVGSDVTASLCGVGAGPGMHGWTSVDAKKARRGKAGRPRAIYRRRDALKYARSSVEIELPERYGTKEWRNKTDVTKWRLRQISPFVPGVALKNELHTGRTRH